MTDPDFERALEDRPGDAGLRLVYADWLDDHGAPAPAAAHRWLAAAGRWPVLCDAISDFVLGTEDTHVSGREYRPALLPPAVFARLAAALPVFGGGNQPHPHRTDTWAYFASPAQAVDHLARALTETPALNPTKWTRMDEEILRRNYATMEPAFILRLLPGRRWPTIARKARSLGLRRAGRLNPMGRPGEKAKPK